MPPDSIPAWVIVAQDHAANDLTPQGVYSSGVRVTFRTSSGTVGSVFVPQADYTVERVRALVAERAAIIEAVNALSG